VEPRRLKKLAEDSLKKREDRKKKFLDRGSSLEGKRCGKKTVGWGGRLWNL